MCAYACECECGFVCVFVFPIAIYLEKCLGNPKIRAALLGVSIIRFIWLLNWGPSTSGNYHFMLAGVGFFMFGEVWILPPLSNS